MEAYIIKSIFVFSILSALVLISCSNDSVWNLVPSKSNPVDAAVEITDAEPIPSPVIEPPPPIKISLCPDGMVHVKNGNFCIDSYEYPNIKGTYPDFAMNAYDAIAACKSVNKRLCTHTEWVNACLGSQNLAYGYGNFWKQGVCNDTASNYIPVDWLKMGEGPVLWKAYAKTLYKAEPSGSREGCYSQQEDGNRVYDLMGNTREWRSDPEGNGGYSFGTTFWYGAMIIGASGATCNFAVKNHDPGFSSYEVGTRCCLDIKP